MSKSKRQIVEHVIARLTGKDLIDEDDDVYTLDDFIGLCKEGMFVDYDGYGEYATSSYKSGIDVRPSEIIAGRINRDYDHVVWYNR